MRSVGLAYGEVVRKLHYERFRTPLFNVAKARVKSLNRKIAGATLIHPTVPAIA